MMLDERERFFYDHAGWSYDPANETSEQGRVRGARQLAAAESVAIGRGWSEVTQYDWDDCADGDDPELPGQLERGELERLIVALVDSDGVVLASLGGVIVPSANDPYVRVVAAELAAELLATHEACHARVTCRGCGNAWCEKCDPAPSWACHWCHGRGESTAPMEPAHEEGEVIA